MSDIELQERRSLDQADLLALAKAQRAATVIREFCEKIHAWCREPEIPDSWYEKLPRELQQLSMIALPMMGLKGEEVLPNVIASCASVERAIEKILV